MVRGAVAVLSAVLFALPALAGQDSKSSELAKQLGQLLDQKKMDSFAAADAKTPASSWRRSTIPEPSCWSYPRSTSTLR